ncbi:MAG: hypothetical protein RLZZ232_1065 [Planctomycetota bacterium]|jgi:hypothetical protein
MAAHHTISTTKRVTRWLSAGLLMSLCVVLAIPLPSTWIRPQQPVPGKDASVPFPCLYRTCGCRSAEDCRKQCCCNPTTQKVAGARRHPVKVPDTVASAAEKDSQPATTDAAVERETSISLTTATPQSARQCADTSASAKDCCDAGNTPAHQHASPPQTIQPQRKWTSILKSLECRGVNLVQLMISSVVSPERAMLPGLAAMAGTLATPGSERLPPNDGLSPTTPPKLPVI